MFKHVLIPTDGSELSQAAAVKGLRFAKEIGARVTGLHVTPAFHVLTFDTVMIEETREEFLADSQAQGDKRMAQFKRSAAEEHHVVRFADHRRHPRRQGGAPRSEQGRHDATDTGARVVGDGG